MVRSILGYYAAAIFDFRLRRDNLGRGFEVHLLSVRLGLLGKLFLFDPFYLV